jgi:hydrogenase maturation protease
MNDKDMFRQNPILIMGLGNELLCDDAIGIRLVSDLEKYFKSPEIQFQTSCTGGLELVETISGFEHVIIIDSIKTQDGIPGNVYHLIPANVKDTLHLSSFHDISFLTALKLVKHTGNKIPEDIHILAIEIVENMLFSTEFSKLIQAKYKTIKKEIKKYLDLLLKHRNYIDPVKDTRSTTIKTLN